MLLLGLADPEGFRIQLFLPSAMGMLRTCPGALLQEGAVPDLGPRERSLGRGGGRPGVPYLC